MTLPVSSPSTHSQFEDCQGGQQFIPATEVFQTAEGHSSPQDVEKRLDELTRYILLNMTADCLHNIMFSLMVHSVSNLF
jgi:hypothetical protein